MLFCDIIMGYKYIGDILADIECTGKGRYGNQNKVTENSNLKKLQETYNSSPSTKY